MDSINSRSKKRKSDSTRDAERSLYSNFVTAANAVSTLYAQAAQSKQDERDAGAREALERVIQFAFREYGGTGAVPLAALVDFANGEVKSPQSLNFPAPYIPQPQPPGSDIEYQEDVPMQGAEALRGFLMNNNNNNSINNGGGHGRR